MGKKYNVPLLLLIISAYPTETRADLEFTKQWFRDRLHYAGNSVFQVAISYASVLPGTKLEERADEYGIKVGKYPSIWFNQNLAVTAEMKANHIHELNEICKPFQTTKSFKNLKTKVIIKEGDTISAKITGIKFAKNNFSCFGDLILEKEKNLKAKKKE